MCSKFLTGKIYKVSDVNNTKSYYGSTINSLPLRIALHKSSYKKFQNGLGNKLSVFSIFDEFGIDNCIISLVEDFPCNSKAELLTREGCYIKNHPCVNFSIAGRTLKEYYIDNKEKYKIHNDKYYLENKNKISTHMKNYYQNNKEVIRLKQRVYNLKKHIRALKIQINNM